MPSQETNETMALDHDAITAYMVGEAYALAERVGITYLCALALLEAVS